MPEVTLTGQKWTMRPSLPGCPLAFVDNGCVQGMHCVTLHQCPQRSKSCLTRHVGCHPVGAASRGARSSSTGCRFPAGGGGCAAGGDGSGCISAAAGAAVLSPGRTLMPHEQFLWSLFQPRRRGHWSGQALQTASGRTLLVGYEAQQPATQVTARQALPHSSDMAGSMSAMLCQWLTIVLVGQGHCKLQQPLQYCSSL